MNRILRMALATFIVAALAACSHGGRSSFTPPVTAVSNYVLPSNARAACGHARPGTSRCGVLIRTDVADKEPTRVKTLGMNILPFAFAPVGYGPSDLQSAYSLPSSKAGTNQTVAIVDAFDDPNAESDLGLYRTQFGLPACTSANGCFKKIDQNGGSNYPTADANWSHEISVDLDMVSAVCPNCKILLVEANSTQNTDLDAAVNQAVSAGAKIVSNSYGGSEQDSDDAAFQHKGVLIVASSGDHGTGAQRPCAYAEVVCVGGTALVRDSSARGWSETAWSGAGSGCSAFVPKPAWQTDTGCAMRSEADVSAVASSDTPVAIYDSYQNTGWEADFGTSVAAPIIAGTFALAGAPSSVNAAETLWKDHGSHLHDVTSGSNGTCSPAYICNAGAGYDGPTGWGTPNGVAAFGPSSAPGPQGVIMPVAATASGNDGNVPGNAIDGNFSTRWSNEGAGSNITVDMGSVMTLSGAQIAWYQGNSRKNTFTISASRDGGIFNQVYSGTSSGATTALEAYQFANTVSARYLKITFQSNTQNDWASITEIRGVAQSAATPTPAPSPGPLGAIMPVAASASGNDGNVPGNAIDGNFSTRWSNEGAGSNITVDMGSVMTLSGAQIAWYKGDSRKNTFTIGASSDGATFNQVYSGTSSGTTTALEGYQFANAVSARYLQITFLSNTQNDWASITEIRGVGQSQGPGPSPAPSPGPPSQDGVQEMYPTAPGGTTWYLDTSLNDPRDDSRFAYDNMVRNAPTVKRTENGITYYEVTAGDISYHSGNPSGKTIRIDAYAGGGKGQKQIHTWRERPDFLYNQRGIRNGERTIYIRLLDSLSSGIHHSIASKINGGPVDKGRSEIETTFPTVSNNGKMGAHWNYEHFPYVAASVDQLLDIGEIPTGQWVGLKTVHIVHGTSESINEAYVDLNPFDANGRPRNHWQKVATWTDRGTSKYNDIPSTWRGMVDVWRIDGWRKVDFTLMSDREITP